MSKYQKLIYSIEVTKGNKERLHIKDDLILDFSESFWTPYHLSKYGRDLNLELDENKRYIITRRFPTGNRKLEIIKGCCIPEYTVAIMECNIEPYMD